jgi:Fic family protein
MDEGEQSMSPQAAKKVNLDQAAPGPFLRLDAELAAERQRLRTAPDGAPRRRELQTLVLEEVAASCALSRAPIELDELRVLVDRGLATGGRPLRTYLVAAAYADAARWVAQAKLPRPGQPLLRLDELVDLHARALRLEPESGPGAWRRTTLPAFRGGVVPPAFWLVPREMARFVERFAAGPGQASPALWVAQALERFDRIRPFASGNGRVGRLVANLLLRRLDLPPFAVRPRDARRYLASLARADDGDPWPLAILVGRSVLGGLQRLAGASEQSPTEELVSVTSLARGPEREALYKAIQRGRLRVVRRGRALYTSAAWLEAYRASRG